MLSGRGKKKAVKKSEEKLSFANFEVDDSKPIYKVTCITGITRNLGNYESARFESSIEIPCNKDNLKMATDLGWKYVESQVVKKQKETDEYLENGR